MSATRAAALLDVLNLVPSSHAKQELRIAVCEFEKRDVPIQEELARQYGDLRRRVLEVAAATLGHGDAVLAESRGRQ